MEYVNARGEKYYLHTTTFTLKGSNKEQRIYFFRKDGLNPEKAVMDLPEGFQVVESKKTGLPVLKKI